MPATKTLTITIKLSGIPKALAGLKQVRQSIKAIQAAAGKMAPDIQQATKSMTKTSGIAKQVTKSAEGLSQGMTSIANTSRAAKAGLSEFSLYADRQISTWGGAAKSMGMYVEKFDPVLGRQRRAVTSLEKLRMSVRGFGTDVAQMAKMQVRWFTSAALVMGIPAMIVKAVKSYGEFEKAIKDIGAVTGATREQLKMLGDEALRVSMITPQSATELANMSRTLVQAGLEATQAAQAMETIAKVATVSGEAMDVVAGTFTTAIFAWKMSAAESKKIGDVVAATLNFSRLQVNDLGTAYNYLAAVASQFNLSFTETNAVMASFSNLGIKASTIGTGLSQVLVRLTVKPPKEFREFVGKDMPQLLKIFESKSPTKFADTIALLEKKGLTAAKAMRIFNLRAGRAMAAALTVGSEGLKEMHKRIDETKQLAEGFNTAMESSANKLAVMKNKAQAFAIILGSALKPVFDSLIAVGGFFLNILVMMAKGFDVIGIKAIALAAVLLILAKNIGIVVVAIRTLSLATMGATLATLPLWSMIAVGAGLLLLIFGAFSKAEGATIDYTKALKKEFNQIEKGMGALKGLTKQQSAFNKIIDESEQRVKDFEEALKGIQDKGFQLPELWSKKYFEPLEVALLTLNKAGLETKKSESEMVKYFDALRSLVQEFEEADKILKRYGITTQQLADTSVEYNMLLIRQRELQKKATETTLKHADAIQELLTESEKIKDIKLPSGKEVFAELIKVPEKRDLQTIFKAIDLVNKTMADLRTKALKGALDPSEITDLHTAMMNRLKGMAELKKVVDDSTKALSRLNEMQKELSRAGATEIEQITFKFRDMKKEAVEAYLAVIKVQAKTGQDVSKLGQQFKKLWEAIASEEAREKIEENRKAIEEQAEAYRNLLNITGDLNRELKLMSLPGVDREKLQSFYDYSDVIAKINELYSQTAQSAKDFEVATEAIRLAAEKHNESLKKNKKTLEDWKLDFEGVMEDMQSTFSDVLFDGMTNNLKNFGDYWNAFWLSITRKVADMWADMIMNMIQASMKSGVLGKTISAIGVLFTGGGGGSVSSKHTGGLIQRMHAGGLKKDEVPTILQAGEYVINRRDTARNIDTLRDINSGRARQTEPAVNNNYTININAADARSFRDMLRRNPGALSEMIDKDLRTAGGLRASIRTFT